MPSDPEKGSAVPPGGPGEKVTNETHLVLTFLDVLSMPFIASTIFNVSRVLVRGEGGVDASSRARAHVIVARNILVRL